MAAENRVFKRNDPARREGNSVYLSRAMIVDAKRLAWQMHGWPADRRDKQVDEMLIEAGGSKRRRQFALLVKELANRYAARLMA